eukprot:403331669
MATIILKKLWYYSDKHPVLSRSISTAMLGGLADFICQNLEKYYNTDQKKPYDFVRTGRFFGFHLVLNGPWLHLLYSRVLPLIGTDKGYKTVVKKIMFLSLFLSFISHGVFFFAMSQLEGHTVEYSIEEVNRKLVPTVTTGWQYWPLVQMINFKLVPPYFQVFYANSMGVIWNAYLSYVKNNNSHHHKHLLNSQISQDQVIDLSLKQELENKLSSKYLCQCCQLERCVKIV